MKDELNWSEKEKGYVLSSFYWGYACGQLPSSLFAQRFGAKHIFGLSVLVPSVLTLLVPLACKSSFAGALLLRALIGFSESASFPCLFHFFPHWVPGAEKTSMITTALAGMYIGEIIGFSLSGVLIEAQISINGQDWGGWPSVFYIFGVAGIVWYPYWVYMAYESPDAHPSISAAELKFIKQGDNICSHRLFIAFSLATLCTGQEYSKLSQDSKDAPILSVATSSPLIVSPDKHMDTEQLTMNSVDIASMDEDVNVIHSLGDDSHSPQKVSILRIPWCLFFTTPATLTLLLAAWTHVSVLSAQ